MNESINVSVAVTFKETSCDKILGVETKKCWTSWRTGCLRAWWRAPSSRFEAFSFEVYSFELFSLEVVSFKVFSFEQFSIVGILIWSILIWSILRRNYLHLVLGCWPLGLCEEGEGGGVGRSEGGEGELCEDHHLIGKCGKWHSPWTIVMTKLQAASSGINWWDFSNKTLTESQVFNFNHQLLRLRSDHVMERCLAKRDFNRYLSRWAKLSSSALSWPSSSYLWWPSSSTT